MPRLCDLHPLFRLAIAFGVVTLLGGYLVSGLHLMQHYENRDDRPGLTLDDIRGAYVGVSKPSPLIAALESGHPETLAPADRSALLEWLASSEVSLMYDDLDLGDDAPAEIIAANCVSCHARGATGDDAYPQLPLEYWDDISPIIASVDVQPNDRAIIAASIHAHAPSMAVILIVLVLAASMTRMSGLLTAGVAALSSIGLLADMAGQWFAASFEPLVYAIVGGGFVYSAGVGLLGVVVLIDCVIPACRKAGTAA